MSRDCWYVDSQTPSTRIRRYSGIVAPLCVWLGLGHLESPYFQGHAVILSAAKVCFIRI